ncbi:inter-alpha-trypsin inhibitor heavy chain H4 isoform X2 [Anoplophora glabripennis]|nr:inter-alpha-trypsin inhibitor heavy chain H4 isoform X2 [Anoplophora glabripennis]
MWWLAVWTLVGVFISSTYSLTTHTHSSLVVSSTEPPKEQASEEQKDQGLILPKIYEMRVDTNVSNRFAKTLITSKVKNLDKSAQAATFSVVLPDQAYISGFTMEIDGKSYEAYVQEKKEAENTYKKAVADGQAAAHVAVSARDSNRFTVSVNIEPKSKATFYLKYEELLQRQNERYELLLNIHPGQPIKKLDVEVHIDESRSLKFVKVRSLRSGNEIAKNDENLDPRANVITVNSTSAIVKFSPDIDRQKQLANSLGTKEENGLAGQFVVQYDVERDPSGGEVLVDGGHFVHFFAPSDLPALPKQVAFILDTSGSMDGIRIAQLKEAMNSILAELKKDDIFNIVEFGTIVKVWNIDKTQVQYESGSDDYYSFTTENPEAIFKNKTAQPLPPAYQATEENLEKAKEVVAKLNAFGGTDIQSALKVGLELVEKNLETDKKHQPLIVFLTDGEATVGEVDNNKIISTISELNSGKCAIFSLSFGDGADRKFLEKISLKNLGFARHIYEAADASLQLQEFYKQISSPLLSKVSFKYVSNVSEVTKTDFPLLFAGSEIVVSGQIDPGFAPGPVEGWGINGPVKLVPVVTQSVGSLERLWAYLTLKQILEQRDAAENKTELTQDALKIALKYSFVSDVSSLVVVKPNTTDSVNTEDASSNSDTRYPIIASGFPLSLHPSSVSAPGLAPSSYYSAGASAFGGSYSTFDSDRVLVEAAAPQEYDSATPVLEDVALNELKTQIPWLSSLLNANGTITLSSGTYGLGLDKNITDSPVCPKTPRNSIGTCELLYKCPQIFPDLTNENVYKNYFCELDGYAGVCCPKEENKN